MDIHQELSSYCYKVMPFGLKNAGATYQRLMDRVLTSMIGWNVQAYVDDMVVTSQEKDQHIADLKELFTTIAKYKLKLNPKKCISGVEAGKFLGFLHTEWGIEVNLEKCVAIIAMRSSTSVKEVQQLTRRMVALSQFVSAGRNRGHPYFQCLKRNNKFVWKNECEESFLKLKEYLASPPVLCKPLLGTPSPPIFHRHKTSNKLSHHPMLSFRALMFQIHMKPEVVLLFGLGLY